VKICSRGDTAKTAKSSRPLLAVLAVREYCSYATSHAGGGKKSEINPMKNDGLSHLSHAARCGAKTRTGTLCESPPVQGRKRCRLHGGLSPGAPRGSRNGNYVRGDWTTEMRQERKWIRDLLRSVLKLETP
jgi:hypothetical protein